MNGTGKAPGSGFIQVPGTDFYFRASEVVVVEPHYVIGCSVVHLRNGQQVVVEMVPAEATALVTGRKP